MKLLIAHRLGLIQTPRTFFWLLLCLLWLTESTSLVAQQWNGIDLNRFEDEVARYEATDPATLPRAHEAVVLTGSSSVRLWQSVTEDLAPLPVLNRGIGGSTFPEVLHFAERLVFRYQPSVVAIYCGENDLQTLWNSPEFGPNKQQEALQEWESQFRKLMEHLHEGLPEAAIFFIAVKYADSRRDIWPMVSRANETAAQFAATRPWLHYIDANRLIYSAENGPVEGIFLADKLHFNKEGYRRWAIPIRQALTPEWFRLQSLRVAPAAEQLPATAWANPMIGVDDDGSTLPGVSLPFSMLRLSPNCPHPNHTNGYRSYKNIVGFSHTHVSGTGGAGRYGNIMVAPQVRAPLQPTAVVSDGKADEYSRPGIYRVRLQYATGSEVRCELTGTERAGLHKYTFLPNTDTQLAPHLLIDASWVIHRQPQNPDPRCLDAKITLVNDSTVEGYGYYTGGWGPLRPYFVYFSALTSEPFQGKVGTQGQWLSEAKEAQGEQTGALLHFPDLAGNSLELRVGISFTSLENARLNRSTVAERTFQEVRTNAQATWHNWMNRIRVEGGTDEQRTLFYTMMYKMGIMPTDVRHENRTSAPGHPHYDDHYTIWDTFRSFFPMFTLIAPDLLPDMLNGLLDVYDATGWLPDAWISQGHGAVQGGSNADVVFADAIAKGVQGFDYAKAYEAMRKNATVHPEDPVNYGRFLEPYLRLGFVPSSVRNSGSRHIEYAYNDYCIAQTAKLLGKDADYQRFLQQSQNVFNLFNPAWKHFWVKDEKGQWLPDFTPGYLADPIWEGPFYEGSPAHYSVCATPHNFAKLIELHGGKANFEAFLDAYFAKGMHWHGNEPGFLAAYAYHYVGRPDKAAEQVRKIMTTDYRLETSGMPGDEDAGAMSSWYIFGALGFYPVAGQDLYLIGSPHFSKATLWMGEGKTLSVRAENLSAQNTFVQSATLNGQSLDRAWFRHAEIAAGGELILQMGATPSAWGRSELPPSPGFVQASQTKTPRNRRK